MQALIEVILPVFLLIGFGYLANWRKWIGDGAVDGLMTFAQAFAVPCLLFQSISGLDLGAEFDLRLLAAFYIGAFVSFGLGYAGARRLFGRSPVDAVAIGFVCLFSNTLLLGLPIMDGLTVLGKWRKEDRNFPVLVLTARDSWSDKVAGLDAGADDYLAKPFQTEELIARLRALIRRASGNTSSELTAGDVRLDTRSGRVTLAGEPVKLTAQEYKLLSYLMHHKGKVVSRTELIEHIYDQDFDRDSNTIEVFVTRIRKKLGADVITTIRGLGYSLDDPSDAPRG